MRDDWFEAYRLHFAAGNGDLELCAQLLAEGRDVNAFDDLGQTLLHYAAENEHIETAELLIARGADVNVHHAPTIGNTPLSSVAGSCSFKMAKLLTDAGADPTIRGWMQLHAIHHAERRKRGEGPRVFELLCQVAGLDPHCFRQNQS